VGGFSASIRGLGGEGARPRAYWNALREERKSPTYAHLFDNLTSLVVVVEIASVRAIMGWVSLDSLRTSGSVVGVPETSHVRSM
jgi:hypothetical protein